VRPLGNTSKSSANALAILLAIAALLWMAEKQGIVKETIVKKKPIDRPPIRRLPWFNAIGVLVALSSPLVIEQVLTTLKISHTHTLLWSGPFVVDALLAVLSAGLVGGLTYLWLNKKTAGGRNVWVAPLTAFGPIFGLSFFFRWGKWPHIGMCCWAIGFGVLSHVFVVCRKARSRTVLKEDLEYLKATVSTWQLITVYGFTAYLAYAISQLYLVWLFSDEVVVSKEEKLLFFACTAFQIFIFSALVFVGPLREAWQMTFDSISKIADLENAKLETTGPKSK